MANTQTDKTELLTDSELCELLRISVGTLRNHMRNGPSRRHRRNVGDIRTIQHVNIGCHRRWVRSSVEEFIHGS